MSWLESHLLTLVIFLPVLGAALVALLPRAEGAQHKGISFVFSLFTFFASIPLWTGFRGVAGKWAFEQKSEWAPSLGFSYHVGLDGVANAFDVLGDPEKHAKILIDPTSDVVAL